MRILRLIMVLGWLFFSPSGTAEMPDDYRYHVEVLAQSILKPMELELAPDGRIFVNDIYGALHIIDPETGEGSVAGRLEVFNEQENGLLGFALDPGFISNQLIYLFYSPVDYSGQRLSRFSMDGDVLDLSTEKVMLEFAEQRRRCCHHAGTVEFAPDGCLLISTGDNTDPGADTAGYAPIDERPDHDPIDAQKSSANTHDLRGKILRIRPTELGTYEIPEGNLFPMDGSAGRPEIFVMGCRNPWRMSVDNQTGIVYWGEVGPDAGSDSDRGPRGYDEINQARTAGNFGWPYFVGNNFPYADHDYATGKNGPRYDPGEPVNESPNNTGLRILPPVQPALIYWPYAVSTEFPVLGSGGRTACAGPVFHFDPAYKATGGFPAYYDNCLLFWDWQRPFIKWARLNSDSELVGVEDFTPAVVLRNDGNTSADNKLPNPFLIQRPVDAQFGPDGCLYLLDYGRTWGPNQDSRLLKISYLRGNLAPVAVATAVPAAGPEPMTVHLSGEGSMDPEGDVLSHTWTLHPGNKKVAQGMEAQITIREPGNYIATLHARDSKGALATASVPIVVGNHRPNIFFKSPREGDFFQPGKDIPYEIHVVDKEDGDSTHNDEFMDVRVRVSAQFQQDLDQSDAGAPGLELMRRSDCFNCHAMHERVVGPPLMDIAEKYRNEAGAINASVQRVIHGSTGVWGDIPMLPHSLFTEKEVEMMVRWIFAVSPDNQGHIRTHGLTGNLKANGRPAERFAVLEANYTDFGCPPAGPLSSTVRVHLRQRLIEAEDCESFSGLQVMGNKLGAISHGATARFVNIPMDQVSAVVVRVASGGPGCLMELREGSRAGKLLGSFQVEPTGGYGRFVELKASMIDFDKRTDIVLVFKNQGKAGLMDLDWIRFDK
jgi:cytochrome c